MSHFFETRTEVTKYANDFIRRVEKYCQDEIYATFKLETVKVDWDKKRRSSRGGMYADGPGINIAMWHQYKPLEELHRVYEYKSFDSDSEIGGFYTRSKWHKLEMVILHEIAHALQYYSYKLNKFRCKPHGPTWRNFYRRLRNVFLNPYLEPQHDAKVEYQGMIDEVEGVKPNSLSRRAASR